MRLSPLDTLTLPDGLEETGQRGLVLLAHAGSLYLYAGTGPGGGIAAWRIDADGPAQDLPVTWYPATLQGSSAGLVGSAVAGGVPHLLLDPGGGATLPGLVAGDDAPRLTTLGPSPLARLSDAVIFDDNVYVAGIGGLYAGATRLAGATGAVGVLNGHLLAAVQDDNALQVWTIAQGPPRATGQLGAAQGLGVQTPTALAVLNAYGRDWAILGAAGSQSLSVIAVDGDGGLTATDHLLDTRLTRFGGVTSLATVQADDRVFVVAGGADDGLSLFTLLPDGRLLHLSSFEHGENPGLMNVTALAAARLGDRLEVAVTSGTVPGVARYGADLSGLGVVRRNTGSEARLLQGTAGDDLLVAGDTGRDTLEGGAGADILVSGAGDAVLRGGAGADVFVLAHGPARLVLPDFDPAADRLDLSAVPFLRNPGQVRLTPTRQGAVLDLNGTEVEITHARGQKITLDDLFGPAFDWPDRVLVLNSLQGRSVIAGPGGGFLKGSEGPDSMIGDAGADILWSGPGDDHLSGGAGADNLGGQDGTDTLDGGPGADTLSGGAGDDWLSGGDGPDVIYGGPGNDRADGGAGNDMLGGFSGDDVLRGGSGRDALWGSWGNDTLEGGPDNDELGGFWGDDVLRGDDGDDTLWGAQGNDTLEGGGGDDLLGGAAGNDRITGRAGDDWIWGAAGNDTLRGHSGSDTLGGGPGDDSLEGGGEADALYGGPGNDTLWGGDEADTLWGGPGDDMLWGGSGADVFVVGPGAGEDSIGGFVPGVDHLQIGSDTLDFDALTIIDRGGDLWIPLGGDSGVTLYGLAPGDLTAGDVLFGW